jgi:HEAT repeat protein
MKRNILLFAVSLILLLSFQIIPQEIADLKSRAKEDCINTLLDGINTNNRGLQAGCAYMLGELSCDRGVVTLLDILHNNKSEELRILAALSLYKIGDSRGIYAIKQAIRFDESDRVSRLCETFYKAYLQEDSSPEIELVLNE